MAGQPPPVAYIEAGKLHIDRSNRTRQSGKDTEALRVLAATIRLFGIKKPLDVVPDPSGRKGHWLIRDGHRRFLAGQMAGLGEFPCMLSRETAAERQAGGALARVVLDKTHEHHDPVETALDLEKIMTAHHLDQAGLAKLTGLSAATISYHLELINLAPEVLDKITSGELTAAAGHEMVRSARAAGLRPGQSAPYRPRPPGTRSTRKPPPYFAAGHRLAGEAYAVCAEHDHPVSWKVGKVACLPAWEAAIAADAVNGGGRERTPQPRDPAEVLAGLGLTENDLLPHVRAALFSEVLPPPVLPAPVFSAGGRP
jgi:ParB/RepB/Spo0J family partition protein